MMPNFPGFPGLPTFQADTAQAVATLHQLLVRLMPRRWSSVRIDVKRDDDGDFVHLTNLNAQVETGGGAMPPALGLDQNGIVAAMNEALGEVATDLGDAWRGLSARLDRTGDGGAALVLLGPDGAEQSHLALTPDAVEALTLSDALFDALDATRPRAHAAQNEFQQAIQGFRQWNATQDRAELSFVLADGRSWAMRGQALGSWSKGEESWMWAWGNESIDPAFAAAAAAVRDGAKGRPGLAALTTPSFDAKQALAVELALHAAAVVGARGVFPGDFGAGIAYIAAMP
jgi:hypothetical protein